MLLFKFPKFLILFFASFILIATAFSAWIKPAQLPARPAPQKSLSHPILFRAVSIAIALSTLAVVCILLFGTVMFLNEWTRWHQYEGQYFERNQFQVTQTYFKRGLKGAIDIYASGTVEGNREWMNLRPYVPSVPRSDDELYSLVPTGTTIPIYFFPHMKGRARVQVFSEIPPAEASHRAAMTTLNRALLALAATLALIFGLTRVRNICLVEP